MASLLTIDQVADELAMSASKITRLVNEGVFPKPVYIGSSKRFRKIDLDKWVEQLASNEIQKPSKKRGRPRLAV